MMMMMAVAHCKLRGRFHALCEIGVDRGSAEREGEGRKVSNIPNPLKSRGCYFAKRVDHQRGSRSSMNIKMALS